jgi:hypothetical protein
LFSHPEFSAVITMLYLGWKKASHPDPRSLSWLYLPAAKFANDYHLLERFK